MLRHVTATGQGYRTSKAVAWVIDVGVSKPAWVARCKNDCSNPLPLKEAKASALATAKTGQGDYRVANSISHLNGLAARLDEYVPAMRETALQRLREMRRFRSAGLRLTASDCV